MSTETKEAMDTLRKAFKDDPHYAYGWYSNIAMCCYDSMDADKIVHEEALDIGREAASRFMKAAFDITIDEGLNG